MPLGLGISMALLRNVKFASYDNCIYSSIYQKQNQTSTSNYPPMLEQETRHWKAPPPALEMGKFMPLRDSIDLLDPAMSL